MALQLNEFFLCAIKQQTVLLLELFYFKTKLRNKLTGRAQAHTLNRNRHWRRCWCWGFYRFMGWFQILFCRTCEVLLIYIRKMINYALVVSHIFKHRFTFKVKLKVLAKRRLATTVIELLCYVALYFMLVRLSVWTNYRADFVDHKRPLAIGWVKRSLLSGQITESFSLVEHSNEFMCYKFTVIIL